MTSTALYRRSSAPAIAGTTALTVIGYLVLLATFDGESWLTEYPFAFAALGGLAVFGVGIYRRRNAVLQLSDTGLSDKATGTSIDWQQVTEVRVQDLPSMHAPDQPVRTVTVATGADEICFGDQDAATNAHLVTSNAPLLLATVAAQTASRGLFPPAWLESTSPNTTAVQPELTAQDKSKLGVVALLFKLGPKFAKVGLKLLKTIKPGAAIVTIGAYSLIFSWKFAVALVVHILVHECGHVYAMWRSGVAVKGIYLIPFFGGAAVSKGIAKTRHNAAYIALNGPVWGMFLCILLTALHFATSAQWPFLGAMAAWGALINLFNLLPILPLDGGRILTSLAHTSSRGLGPVITFGSLLLGAMVAYFADLQLLVLMVFIGLMEFAGHLAAAPYARSLQLIGDRPMGAAEIQHFANLLIKPRKGRGQILKQRIQEFASRRDEAAQTPMNARQVFTILAGYIAVALVLIGLLYACTSIEGAGNPLDMLR